MPINEINKKMPVSLSSSDIKRLEETFLKPPEEKDNPPKKKHPIFLYTSAIIFAILLSFFSLKYKIIIIPKIKNAEKSLLSSHLLDSIEILDKNRNIRISQGTIYLSLLPQKKQGFILNTKNPIDLNKNSLFLSADFLKADLQKENLRMSVITKDEKYFSNALNPLTIEIGGKNETEDIPPSEISLAFTNNAALQVNFSRINQIRFLFYNSNDEPVSLLIKDVRIGKRRDK